ncbi:hypothetical protein QUQ58_004974 [Escherichia coli]|nr:hypothetical protein [Escherichia coli]
MTDNDRSIPDSVFQSLSRLDDDIQALSSLACLIPIGDGEPDTFDYGALGELVRLVSRSLQSDFKSFQETLLS